MLEKFLIVATTVFMGIIYKQLIWIIWIFY